jgi:aryl-alcohol dehydrogenase-like predicted oxidoreductase
MKKVKLGNSDLEITILGLGAWAMGGAGWEFGWGHQDDKNSIEAIHKALELGVNWIDTAAVYGCGHSEEVVAKTLKEWGGAKPYVFTKCSMIWDKDKNTSVSYEPKSIRKECEDSLKRLKLDVIDLYQVHKPPLDGDEKIDAVIETIANLKDEGKVKWIGVSNYNVEQLERAMKIAPVTSLQPPYNLINHSIEKEILPYCKKNGLGVLVYSPMSAGLLTGTFTKERVANLPQDDWRKRSPNYLEPKLTNNLRLAEKLKEIAKIHNRTAGEIAIAWTLMNPAVTAAIVGVRNAAQTEIVMKAGDVKISANEKAELESVLG